ncbi:uncharacterized protein LOC34617411 [Cyclospora cayetanensis]|uniref:Uncharacterized protein LOC34617411 n=1 Tax=Cyclospora cayetanensis TaxID=88456 RepID=A0A6P6RUS5_9EIME|nr:uncharacterized protein LOC34617411 [Cyclospora cayetanensis]
MDCIVLSDLRIQLLGGLDGIMGVMVRKQNLKRMGLLLSDGPDCRLLPFKHFPKKDVLQEIASRGNESDWTDHKTVIKAYPLDKLLLVRDDPGNYGANYLMPFSEMAYQAVHEAVLAAQADAIATKEEEVKRQLLSDGEANIRLRNEEFDAPQSPRQWQSETSAITAAEIAAMTIKTKRALLKQTVIKDGHTLNVTAPVQPFTGQPLLLRAPKVSVVPPKAITLYKLSIDVLLSCVAQSIAVQDSLSVDLKQELEFGIQAVPPTAERCCQAAGLTVKAVEMQHDSSALSRKAGVSTFTSRKNLKTFFSAVESMMEEALQQNEAVDVLKEEYMPLEESGNAEEHVKVKDSIREAFTFSDLLHSKNKVISSVRWVPESGALIACAIMEASSFDERVESQWHSGKSLILIWSLQEPLAPQHIFEAPAVRQTELIVQLYELSSLLSSAIDYSHKRPVQHIKPLPASLDFRRSLAIYFNPKAESTHVLSCGADGGIFVWDIATAVANAEHAEFLWKPVLQCQLRKQDTALPSRPTARYSSSCCKIRAVVQSRVLGLMASDIRSKLDINVTATHAATDAAPSATRCFRPSRAFQLSPFLPQIAVLVTEFAFHILSMWHIALSGVRTPAFALRTSKGRKLGAWHDYCLHDTAAFPYPTSSYSCGAWSASRPGVLFIGRIDGSLEVWDIRDQLQKPIATAPVSAAQLTALAFPDLRQQEHQHQPKGDRGRRKSRNFSRHVLATKMAEAPFVPNPAFSYLAVGDAVGSLRVLRLLPSLSTPYPEELSNISTMLLNEDERLDYLNFRKPIHAKVIKAIYKAWFSFLLTIYIKDYL